jgi:hypothetical protein
MLAVRSDMSRSPDCVIGRVAFISGPDCVLLANLKRPAENSKAGKDGFC